MQSRISPTWLPFDSTHTHTHTHTHTEAGQQRTAAEQSGRGQRRLRTAGPLLMASCTYPFQQFLQKKCLQGAACISLTRKSSKQMLHAACTKKLQEISIHFQSVFTWALSILRARYAWQELGKLVSSCICLPTIGSSHVLHLPCAQFI